MALAKFGLSPPFLHPFPVEGLDGLQRRERESQHPALEGHVELIARTHEEGPGARRRRQSGDVKNQQAAPIGSASAAAPPTRLWIPAYAPAHCG
jgi:hypothetical protein